MLVILPQDQDSIVFIPSKLFEYARYPSSILALEPEGTATAQLLSSLDADVVDPSDPKGIASVLQRRILEHRRSRYPQPVGADERLSRFHQAKRLFAMRDELNGSSGRGA